MKLAEQHQAARKRACLQAAIALNFWLNETKLI